MSRRTVAAAGLALVVGLGVGLAAPPLWQAYSHRPAHISDATTEPASRAVTVLFGSCNYPYSVEFTETDEAVTVTIITDAHWRDPCEDIGNEAQLVLNEPLGDRALIDGATGEHIPVSPPVVG